MSDDAAMTAAPTWTRLDQTYKVTRITVDRGRSYELEKTGTGTATVELVDKTGAFDPTQSPLVDVMNHVAVCLDNPTDPNTWPLIFRGFVSIVRYSPYQDEKHANVTIECVDGLALLAAMEMTPDGTFGDAVVDGNIVFDQLDHTDAVQRRIGDGSSYTGVLSQAGWPTGLRQIFTGNVWLQKTVYAPRSSVLQVLQDAADAEFPGVANVYVNKFGEIVFHGRLARFDPVGTSSGTDWAYTAWGFGDDAAVLSDPTMVRISPPLDAFRDDSNLFTSAIATPQNVADGDIAAQYAEDATAVTAYGRRTWSAENLATGAQDTSGSTTALQATGLFRDYYLDNYKQPRTRVGEVTVKGQRASGPYGQPNWDFLCNADISDSAHLATSHFGYSAFDDDFFVEGLHYVIEPGNGSYPTVVCTVDLSPASYFANNPF